MKYGRCAITAAAAIAVSGCNRPASPPANASPPVKVQTIGAVTPLSDADLASKKVNEDGLIPILEYHSIGSAEKSMQRSEAHFRQDLETLYSEGYRPILLSEYLNNHVTAPAGTTPVIFTFDDARQSQFRYLPDGSLDPDCALGIWQAFAAKHSDFPIKATFYVLPLSAFGQPKLAAQKMKALLDMGCEIGNHTVSHNSLKKMTDSQVQGELAGCVALIHKFVPQAKIDTIALPMGISPRNKSLLASGEDKGVRYANRAVLLVGAEPAPAPVSLRYKPMRLPRIQACEGPSGITYWLDRFHQNPETRYYSDGDPETVTIPRSEINKVNRQILQGAKLRVY